ncbi:hypothetical protein E2C01_083857 [Portunus trituberculatus]|uniref:Uncharacterized protein n=1 Tax=Portunus trituberculatus TaxID=210409 RepID=A0A5B7IY63_PORTR|nr:hypothetical protein [Portunus trituberculatus]
MYRPPYSTPLSLPGTNSSSGPERVPGQAAIPGPRGARENTDEIGKERRKGERRKKMEKR